MSQVCGEVLGLHYSTNCETCETGYLAITKKHGTSIKQIDSTDTSYITSEWQKEYKNQGHLDVRYMSKPWKSGSVLPT